MSNEETIEFSSRAWSKLYTTDNLAEGVPSTRVNDVILRFDAMYRASLPSFSRQEWLALFYANNGYLSTNEEPESQIHVVWLNLVKSHGLDEQYGVSIEELSSKILKLPIHRKIAVVEAVYRFWMEGDYPVDDENFKRASLDACCELNISETEENDTDMDGEFQPPDRIVIDGGHKPTPPKCENTARDPMIGREEL